MIPVDIVIPDPDEEAPPIRLVNRKGEVVGGLEIPKGAFDKGTYLKVQPFQGQPPDEEEEDDCGEKKKKKRQTVSTSIELTAFTPKGKKASLKKPVKIELTASLPKGVHPSEVCFGFNQGKGSKWKCETEGLKFRRLKGKSNTWEISREFDHFTGFSLLLGDSSGDCRHWGVMQWLTMAFLIGAGVLSVIICTVYTVYVSRHETREMEKVLKTVSNVARVSV